jgi:hypothetical protein
MGRFVFQNMNSICQIILLLIWRLISFSIPYYDIPLLAVLKPLKPIFPFNKAIGIIGLLLLIQMALPSG